MKSKGLALVLAVLFLLPGLALMPYASSHPPPDMVLEYYYPEQMLNVTITHESNRPLQHYVRKVTISRNGEHEATHFYGSHPGGGDVHTYRYDVPANYGDFLNVTAECSEGGSTYREIVVSWFPSVPRNLVTAAGDKSISLMWDPPFDTGGLEILYYDIFRRNDGEIRHIGSSQVGHIGYFDVGLTNDKTYEYQITAVNSFGESPPTPWMSAVPKESRSISLLSNNDFHNYPGLFSGRGTANDPWVLENRLIDGKGVGYGIYICDVTEHLIIRNNIIVDADMSDLLGGGSGIYIQDSRNIFIEYNTLAHNIKYGISVLRSSNLHIEGNRIYGSENGIFMGNSYDNRITRNFVNSPPDSAASMYNPIYQSPGENHSGEDAEKSQDNYDYKAESVIVKFLPQVDMWSLDIDSVNRILSFNRSSPSKSHMHGPGAWTDYFSDEPAANVLKSIEERVEGSFKSAFPSFGMAVMSLSGDRPVESVVQEISSHPLVEYAEPDYFVQPIKRPDDPDYNRLWNLHRLYGMDAIGAWETTTGSREVVVAVLDTGVDYNHEDLRDNMWVGPNGEHGYNALNNNRDPMDKNGHGTHVAGTIGAVGNNSIGITGVNWDVGIMALKFLGDEGGTVSGAVACMNYVLEQKKQGVNVVATSNSWGGRLYSKALYDAISVHRDEGILFITGSGNQHTDNDMTPYFPSNYDLTNVISVTSYNANMEQVYNFGEKSVHLGAPGVNIYSTLLDNRYGSRSGTSMSTPHVSGLVALIASAYPEYDYVNIKNLIMSSTEPISSLQGRTITGGIVNANNAINPQDPELNVYIHGPSPTEDHLSGVNMLGSPMDITVMVSDGIFPVIDADISISLSTGEETLYPVDDGVMPDQVAMDGYYTARWIPEITGDVTLTIIIDTPLGSITEERNIHIFGGNRGVYLSECSSIRLDNNTISFSVEGVFISRSYGISIMNNNVSNIREHGLRINIAENVDVVKTNFYYTGSSSIFLENVKNVFFQNCDITPWRHFVGPGIVAKASEWLVLDNVMVSNFYNSIMFEGVADSSISNSTFLVNGYSAIFLDESERIVIEWNNISIGRSGVSAKRSIDTVIRGNTASYMDMGFECMDSNNTYIANNNITNISGRGVSLLYSRSPTIFNNTFEACTYAGISSIMSSQVLVDTNRFHDNHIGIELRGGYDKPNLDVKIIDSTFSGCGTSVFSNDAENVFIIDGKIDVPLGKIGLRASHYNPVSLVNVSITGFGTAVLGEHGTRVNMNSCSISQNMSRHFVFSGSSTAHLLNVDVSPDPDNPSQYLLGLGSSVVFLSDLFMGVRTLDGEKLSGAEIVVEDSRGKTVYHNKMGWSDSIARIPWKRYQGDAWEVIFEDYTPHVVRASLDDMWDKKVVDLNETSSVLLYPIYGRPSIIQAIPDIVTNRDLARTPAVDLLDYFQHDHGSEVLYFYSELREVLETSSGEEGSGMELSGEQGRYVDVVPIQGWHGREVHRIYATDSRTTVQMDVLVVVRDSDSAIIPLGLPSVYMRDGIIMEYGPLDDYFIDPHGLELVFSIDGVEGEGVDVFIEGDVLFVESNSRWEGAAEVSLTASNMQGDSVTSILFVEVYHVNQNPLCHGLPDVKLVGGESIVYGDLNDYFYDPDGDALTFTVVSTNTMVNVLVDEEGILYIESFKDRWGPEEVSIEASDAWGAFTTASFSLFVERYNFPVESSPIPPFSLYDNTESPNVIYLYDYFRDLDRYPEPMRFSHTGGEGLGISLHLGMVSLHPRTRTPHSQLPKTFIVTFHATDGEYTASEEWAVTLLKEENPPSLVSPIPDVSLYSGEHKDSFLHLSSYFHSLDPVEYTVYGNSMVDISICSDGKVTFLAPERGDGVDRVTFRASNEYGFAEDTVDVVVIHIPSPPYWKPLPTAVMDEDGYLERWIDLRNFVESAETPVSSLRFDVSRQHSEVSVVLDTSILSMYPKQGWYGTVSIVVSVSDDFVIVNTTLNIEVNVVNQPPTAIISSPEHRSAHYSRTGITFDASESTHREGLSEYMWDMGDGRIRTGATIGHIYAEEGTYTVVLTVVDIHGDKDTISIDIMVGNSPPVITSVHPEERNVEMDYGGRRTFYVVAEDLNDPVLTYSWFVDGKRVHNGTGYVFNPPSTGLFSILIEVSDGLESVTHSWIVEVGESLEKSPASSAPQSSEPGGYNVFADILSPVSTSLFALFILAAIGVLIFSMRTKKRQMKKKPAVVLVRQEYRPVKKTPVVTLISK